MRKPFLFLVAAVALGLTACSVEESQELHSSNAEQGVPSYQGTGTNFVAKGWTTGDKRSWEQSLKVRLQQGQNEYNRVN